MSNANLPHQSVSDSHELYRQFLQMIDIELKSKCRAKTKTKTKTKATTQSCKDSEWQEKAFCAFGIGIKEIYFQR